MLDYAPVNVLFQHTHTSLAKNAGRPKLSQTLCFLFGCISLKPSEVRGRVLVDVIVDDYPKE